MSYWFRKKSGHVYVILRRDGKNVPVPRDKTRHLDLQPDDVVERFVESLDPKVKVQPISDEELTRRVDEFCQFEIKKGINPETVRMKRLALLNQVIPYYLTLEPPIKDPNYWPQRAPKLLDYFHQIGMTENLILKANTAIKGFFQWMQEEGLVDQHLNIRLRRPRIEKKDTPLNFTVTPDDLLNFAQSSDRAIELRFIALVGFFFSLRTQETLALTKSDFCAGSLATTLECCKIMYKSGLYSRLAVNINKQHSKSLKDKKVSPKSGSKGWVACFDGRAASLIVEMIKKLNVDKGDDQPLVSWTVDRAINRWDKEGFPGLTMKDLRRASIYWLGHHTPLGIVELKSHARHSKVDTTALYLRRPEESVKQVDDLDLDA